MHIPCDGIHGAKGNNSLPQMSRKASFVSKERFIKKLMTLRAKPAAFSSSLKCSSTHDGRQESLNKIFCGRGGIKMACKRSTKMTKTHAGVVAGVSSVLSSFW